MSLFDKNTRHRRLGFELCANNNDETCGVERERWEVEAGWSSGDRERAEHHNLRSIRRRPARFASCGHHVIGYDYS